MFSFQELNELKNQLPTGHAASEKNDDAPCTLEEIERAQKDLLERGLQVVTTERQLFNNYTNHISVRPHSFTLIVLKGKLMFMSLRSPNVSASRWRTCASIC